MKYGLPADAIDKILSVFSRHPEIDKAILYGSRALGTQREGSDIDITLVPKQGADIELGRLASELDDCNLPYLFDLSSYAVLTNAKLIAHIDQSGITFYQS